MKYIFYRVMKGGIVLSGCLLLCLLLSAYEVNIGNNSVHTGVVVINGKEIRPTATGPVVSERRNTGPFSAVDISGSFEAEITCGKAAGLVVMAEKSLLPKIISRVSGNTLQIGIRGNISTTKPIRLLITLPDLESIKADGASSLNLQCKGSKLGVVLSDSVELYAQGSVRDLRLILDDASEVHGEKYHAVNAFVETRDSASATIFVTGSLDATAYGASEILYDGGPARVNAQANDASDIGPL